MALLLFLLTNIIGRHAGTSYVALGIVFREDRNFGFNVLYRIASPMVFLLILSAILIHLGYKDISRGAYFVVVYYLLFRIGFNLSLGRSKLLNWSKELFFLIPEFNSEVHHLGS